MDHDGFWKEALDRYLEPFLRLCFPGVHAGIDWSRPRVPLDQELRQFLGDTRTRKRQVDRLYRVTACDGTEEYLFLHVEVQSQPDRRLPQRIYCYYRRLYERGYAPEDVVELFRLIDWLLKLPEELEVEFQAELTEYEGQKRMPYITSIERMSLKRGRQEGRQIGLEQGLARGRQEGKLLAAREAVRLVLETRFGRLPAPLLKHLMDLNDLARLKRLLRRASAVGSLDEFATR